MGFQVIKETKKSTIYRHTDFPKYRIKISEGGFAHNRKDPDQSIEEILILTITNDETEKSSEQRCFQDEDEILNQIENDLKLKGNRQFERVWCTIG
ncbi:hypothetical protein KDJ56_03250 [Brevibacillus composti]|uniref:Uncharacterized protein n=1 Tax=Brevibacillus composti TaxID=2796470 RepID=A0A7T5ELY6_9BACL|nr:hypothetical protein [Brevibacillus composti]QQE74978.1 hypothetical protein JD108_03245 [Brevibacillus composti]QUO42063.1 hypothetical protein KDJ56_03250 [Brevibacillus composti]